MMAMVVVMMGMMRDWCMMAIVRPSRNSYTYNSHEGHHYSFLDIIIQFHFFSFFRVLHIISNAFCYYDP